MKREAFLKSFISRLFRKIKQFTNLKSKNKKIGKHILLKRTVKYYSR